LVDSGLANVEQPVTADLVGRLITQELIQRTSLAVYGDADCLLEERPGLPRANEGIDPGDVVFRPVICRVNGLRTNSFSPRLSLGDLRPEELQRVCTPEVVDGKVQLNCKVLTADCPGNDFDGTCLRVPDVRTGEAVILQGLNFFNVAARVRLTAKAPGTTIRELDAHVCGDVTTPLTETADGRQQPIRDCRVNDLLTFKVPEDLPDGIYGVVVIVPNNTGVGVPGSIFESLVPQFIRVLPPETATFQIASERLDAIDETDPDSFGSDEVAVRFLTVPIGPDLKPGAIVENSFRFDDMDSGDSRDMNRVLFRQGNVGGVSLVIIGFEVDDEDTFTKQIQSFSDAYVNILKGTWDAVAGTVGSIGGGIAAAAGLAAGWAAAIAAAITFAIDVFVAWWAPADLIIEDAASFLASDLAALTGANFPSPPASQFTSAGDIRVSVQPFSKDVQYTEHRDYRSEDEGSHYRITLRYNRF
jgi:hypothetical protein